MTRAGLSPPFSGSRKHLRRRTAGFTLVEMLVVMVLLALVMLALVSALRTVGQTQERIDARLAQTDELQAAVAFIRSSLGRISARKARPPATIAAGSSRFLFAGTPDAVAWVGVMPARFGAGGRSFFRLAAEPLDDGRVGLVIRFKPWAEAQGGSTFPDWASADSRVLVTDLASVAIRYQGASIHPDDGWLPRWSDPEHLPERAQLVLRTTASDWPPLIIPLRQLPLSDERNVTFSVGGSRK